MAVQSWGIESIWEPWATTTELWTRWLGWRVESMSPLDSGARIFPLPAFSLPFTNSRSRRVQQRYARTRTATIVANNCISALNSLHVSFAHSSSSSPFLSHNLYSRTRQRLLDNIYNLSNDLFVAKQLLLRATTMACIHLAYFIIIKALSLQLCLLRQT